MLTFAALGNTTNYNRRFSADVVAVGPELARSGAQYHLGNPWVGALGSDVHLRNASDGHLMDWIGIGEKRALAEFYDRFAGIVNGLARRALGDAAAQEIM